MPISTGFNRVATLSTDLDRHAEWWGRVFGAVVTFKMDKQADHPRMFILDVGGGAALNVFEVSEDEIIGERRRQAGRADRPPAIAVESLQTLEAVKQRLIDAGADIGDIQQLGSEWSLFFRDIDGMEFESCPRPPTDPGVWHPVWHDLNSSSARCRHLASLTSGARHDPAGIRHRLRAELANAVVDHPVVAACRQRWCQCSHPSRQAVARGQFGAEAELGA